MICFKYSSQQIFESDDLCHSSVFIVCSLFASTQYNNNVPAMTFNRKDLKNYRHVFVYCFRDYGPDEKGLPLFNDCTGCTGRDLLCTYTMWEKVKMKNSTQTEWIYSEYSCDDSFHKITRSIKNFCSNVCRQYSFIIEFR